MLMAMTVWGLAVGRPQDIEQDIEDEEAMSFFGGSEGDADESQG